MERPTVGTGIVLARPPPGGDATGMNAARVTTSGGTVPLEGLRFFVHEGGEVAYEATHVGEAGREPRLAYLAMELGS